MTSADFHREMMPEPVPQAFLHSGTFIGMNFSKMPDLIFAVFAPEALGSGLEQRTGCGIGNGPFAARFSSFCLGCSLGEFLRFSIAGQERRHAVRGVVAARPVFACVRDVNNCI
ncbi:hypothetical protein [Mesorhizobium sp. KR1-2]|uniref:hypothetical protein n=1 Tax=Mesorhizobium sp. KR1-2 TaxID=3156609 RepID=UPI0032B4BE0D